MKSSLWALQQALYTRLSTYQPLLDRVTGVYDAVPDNQAFPYVTLGEDTAVDWSTKLNAGENVTHTLHVWSRYNGKKEAKELLSLMLEAVSSEPLVLSGGFSCDFAGMDFQEVFIDEDGETRHGVLRLRFFISQPAESQFK